MTRDQKVNPSKRWEEAGKVGGGRINGEQERRTVDSGHEGLNKGKKGHQSGLNGQTNQKQLKEGKREMLKLKKGAQ